MLFKKRKMDRQIRLAAFNTKVVGSNSASVTVGGIPVSFASPRDGPAGPGTNKKKVGKYYLQILTSGIHQIFK